MKKLILGGCLALALIGTARAACYGVFVGLNEYSTSYISSSSWLDGCVPDANHVYTNAIRRGGWTNATVTRLLNSAGSKTAIRQAISNYAATAVSGDTFLYYHSSHGGQNSGTSVFLCTYNADYQDTELATDLATFSTGVKVVVVVDACHSGGLFKSTKDDTRARAVKGEVWDLAGSVTRIMDETLAVALASGIKSATARVSSSEIGWITAADYDEYSWDGDDGGLFTSKLIEGWTNPVASSCDLNGDGYANFYELYDYSWDVANSSEYEYTQAQAENTNVLLSTTAGWIGPTAPGGQVVFSNLTAQTVVVGQTLTYPVGAYTAGTNLPATVTMTTVQAGASYAAGQLTFTPTNDGTYTFNFSATNSAGSSATTSLSVAATLAAPAAIWASATNNVDFTAAWSAVSGASSYRLDVATNVGFSAGGSGSNLVEEGFASASPSGWTIDAGGTYSSSPYVGTLLSGTYSIKFSTTGDSAVTPTFATGATNLQFWAYGNGGSGSTFAVSGLVGSVWTLVDTVTIAANGATYDVALDSQTTQIGFYFTKTYNVALDDVIVQAPAGASSYVAGYQNRTVAGTSQSVTGLTAGTTYYFRSRAVGNATGANSPTASVATVSVLSAPVFGANPGPVAATAGVAAAFTVTADGYPTPTLALAGQTASSGYGFNAGTGELTYTPPQADAGARTFTFSATNSQGTASQVVTVNVAAATAPAFTGGSGPYSTTAGVQVAFAVTASGTPAPTLALAGQTASGGYGFTPATGAFTYTPPTGDVGTQTFTFTAANAAGTVTQVTSVAVAAVPTAPDAPASVWASATNATDFTAAWSSSAGATSYRLDVGTNATFSGGGGAGNLMSNAGFESGDGTDWDKFESEYSVASTDPQEGTYHVTCTATATRDLMQMVDVVGDGATEYEISYWYKASGGNTRIWGSWASGGQDSGDSLQPGTYNAQTSEWTKITYAVVPSSGTNTLNFEVRTYSGATAEYDNFFVGVSGGGGGSSFVPGYEDRTVAGTSQSVTGLTENTTYYFRVRAVNGVGASADSATASATTTSNAPAGTPPTMDAIAAQSATAGGTFEYTVTATATDGDPILSYACASAVSSNLWDLDAGTGYFLFSPTAAEVGTNLFAFTATDKDGTSASVQMSVRVYTAAATNEFTMWVEDQAEDPEDPDFAESADADGDGQTTYEEYLADTDPASSNEVYELTGNYVDAEQAGAATGEIRFSFPASPRRYYQLVYSTDLSGSTTVSNLGWGSSGMMTRTNKTTGAWFGTIRVLLNEP